MFVITQAVSGGFETICLKIPCNLIAPNPVYDSINRRRRPPNKPKVSRTETPLIIGALLVPCWCLVYLDVDEDLQAAAGLASCVKNLCQTPNYLVIIA